MAVEEYLLKQGSENIFMPWQDTSSVVTGKHQRLRSEVDKKWVEQEQAHIARRFLGKGTVYHDLGSINLTLIETAPRLPEFVTYLQQTLDFLNFIGLMVKGDERLGIYLNGLETSGSVQRLYESRVLYHCTLLYDTDLATLHKTLDPEPMANDEALSSVYATPSVRNEVTNIQSHSSEGTVTNFKEKAFQYFSDSQSANVSTGKEIDAVNQFREGKYIQKEWTYSR